MVVTLEPLATIAGRMIETDGKPAMAVAIRTAVFGHFDRSLDEVATDADGRFLVAGVPVGCQYELQVESTTADEAGTGYTSPSGPEAKPVSVRPGQTTDLGDASGSWTTPTSSSTMPPKCRVGQAFQPDDTRRVRLESLTYKSHPHASRFLSVSVQYRLQVGVARAGAEAATGPFLQLAKDFASEGGRAGQPRLWSIGVTQALPSTVVARGRALRLRAKQSSLRRSTSSWPRLTTIGTPTWVLQPILVRIMKKVVSGGPPRGMASPRPISALRIQAR